MYRLAGLAVASEIVLPELLSGGAGEPDVSIRVSSELPAVVGLEEVEPGWWVGPAATLFEIEDVGRFLVRDGRHILVEPKPGCDPASLRLFLLGSAFGAIFHQRGLLPLHAGGVVLGEGCYAFGGDSGVGKSTLGAFLRRRGYRSLADDVLVVELGEDGPRVLPGYPQTKLWADTAHALGLDVTGRAPVDVCRDKYYVEIDREESFCDQPRPFRRFYVLANGDGAPAITRLGHAEALAALTRNTYRAFMLKPMGQWPRHFESCAALVRQIGVYRFARPRDLGRMEHMIDVLEAHFKDGSL
jgi:hypothetical protein